MSINKGVEGVSVSGPPRAGSFLGFGVPLSPLMVLHPHFLAVNGGVVLEALGVQL
jgi:hypothetical protein